MDHATERGLEAHIRSLIDEHITKLDRRIYALRNKKAVDIVICKDDVQPQLFFIEVKYHKLSHGRLGFGSGKGGGFQPEIINLKPAYLEANLRWVLASEVHEPDKVLFISSEVLRGYLAGGLVGEKFNNIQSRIFREQCWLSERQFIDQLRSWIGVEGSRALSMPDSKDIAQPRASF